MAYSQTFDVFAGTGAQGTNLLTTPDHALDHRTLGSAVGTLEHVIGTTNGTQALMNFQAGDFAARINSGGTLQQGVIGTVNLMGQGTSSGTMANGVYGTATWQGGTVNGAVIGTPQASGIFSNGNITGNGTINWTNGDRQCGTMTGNGTLAFSGTVKGQILTLVLYQNATGGFTCVFPTMKWPGTQAGTIGTVASSIHTLTTLCDQNGNLLSQLSANYG